MKIKLTFAIILAFTTICNSQNLNDSAKEIRIISPAAYSGIVTFSFEKWGDGHKDLVYEINLQSNALLYILSILKQEGNKKRLMQEVWDAQCPEEKAPICDYGKMVKTYKIYMKD